MDKLREVPVLLLTGYLGSGKTTLLNRILNNRRGIRFAVIVNDIGEVNIDADLIAKGGVVGQNDDSLVPLQNGCICCTLKMDLVQQLSDLANSGNFDYIVIEASGICEPEPIAQTICSMPNMGEEFNRTATVRLDCITTVVDALRLRDEFAGGDSLTRKNIDEEDIENLIIQQIEFCDIILLNKTDEVTADELRHIRQVVRALQPTAEIIECSFCDVDFDRILDTHKFRLRKSLPHPATWVKEIVETSDAKSRRKNIIMSMNTTTSMRMMNINITSMTIIMTMTRNMRTTRTATMSMAYATVITTITTMRVRPRNMESAHSSTLHASHSRSTSSTGCA